jgi:hypothetical protein
LSHGCFGSAGGAVSGAIGGGDGIAGWIGIGVDTDDRAGAAGAPAGLAPDFGSTRSPFEPHPQMQASSADSAAIFERVNIRVTIDRV